MMKNLRLSQIKKFLSLPTAALLLTACSGNKFTTKSAVNLGADSSRSTVSVVGPFIADGTTPIIVMLSIRDLLGSGVSGQGLSLQVSGTGNTVGSCTMTDSDGAATCWFKTSVAETKIVKAIGDFTLQTTATILPAPMPGSFVAIVSTGDSQILSTGHVIQVSSGLVESDFNWKDTNGSVRMQTSLVPVVLKAE